MTTSLENRIGVGSRLYHMTNERSWGSICKSEFLKPFSLLPKKGVDCYDGQFIVCGVKKDFGDFKEYGLLDALTKYVREKEFFPGKIILLSFTLKNTDGVYVRDYSYNSPKVYVDLCGKDLFKEQTNSMKMFFLKSDELELINRQKLLGRQSTIPIQQYDGSYKVTEIWVPYAVPISELTVEEEDFTIK